MICVSRSFRLRSFISLLLVATTTVTMGLVGGIILLYRIPQINEEARTAVQQEAVDKAQLLEFALDGLESQLRPVAAMAGYASSVAVTQSLEALIGQGKQFLAVYVVSQSGSILSGAFSKTQGATPSRSIDGDLSRNLLFRSASQGKAVWSDRYLSAQSGNVTIGVASTLGRWTVVGEIAPQYLHNSVNTVSGRGGEQMLIVDRAGEYIAGNDGKYTAADNLGALPIVKDALAGQGTGQQLEHYGEAVFAGSTKSDKLGWYFIVTRPAGMGNHQIRITVVLVIAGFGGSLLVGLLLATLWARGVSRPIQRMIDRTHRFAEGDYAKTTETAGRITELNTFAEDLQRMADAVHERELEMLRSKECLRASLESTTSVAIQWYDIEGRVLYWNKASEFIYGFSAKEAIGSIITETPLMFQNQEQAIKALGIFKEVELSGLPYGPAELQLRRQDGGNLVVLSSTFAIPGENGKNILVCMDVDVTERKRAESDLQDSEKELKAIFNASPAAMSVSDANNEFRTIKVNDAWERQFCRQKQDVIGLQGTEMGIWSDGADRERFRATIMHDGFVDEMEAVLLRGDGQPLLCSITAQIAEIGGNRLILMVTTDITDRRRIETEIRELNAELENRVAKRTEELSGANEELATTLDNLRRTQKELVQTEKLASLGALVAGVAHELNTPIGNAVTVSSTLLNAQVMFSERVKTSLSRSVLNGFVDSVGEIALILDRNLHRAAELVGSFKQLAVDQSSYQRRPFYLQDVANEIILAMGPSLRKTSHKVHNEIEQGIRLDSYPGPLGQVLMNLINNALIHAFTEKDSGSIFLRTKLIHSGWIAIDVCDDGCGISEENQKRIFDPFFTTRLGQGGSGLGLHIAFNLVVDLLGGKLDVTSTPGKGSCFHLQIPTVAPQPMAQTDALSYPSSS